MSVFKVVLNNEKQGMLDLDPSSASASQINPSLQRTIFVAGPNRTYRKLKDGDQFTDCNYWKRFAYPNMPMEQAFIEVVSDDGSIYSDISDENTFPLVYSLTVVNGTSYNDAGNSVDIAGDTNSYAVFVQISNQGGTPVKVRLNGTANAIFDLGAGEVQVFNHGDLSITKLDFANTVSGGTDTTVQVILSVKSICLS